MTRQLILGIALLTSTSDVIAQTAQPASYLPASEAIRQVMDGQPWNGLAANGRKAKITLNKDGSGKFDGGPFAMAISWERKGEDICLNLGMAGTKCVRFAPIVNGYQAYVAGKPDLAFTR